MPRCSAHRLAGLAAFAALGVLVGSCAVAPYFERARVTPGPAVTVGACRGVGYYSEGEAPHAWWNMGYAATTGVLQFRYGLSDRFSLGLDGAYGLVNQTEHDSADTNHLRYHPYEARLTAKLAISDKSAWRVGLGYGHAAGHDRADRFYVPFDISYVRDIERFATVSAGVGTSGFELGGALHHPIAGPLTGHLAAKAVYIPFMSSAHLALGYGLAVEPKWDNW